MEIARVPVAGIAGRSSREIVFIFYFFLLLKYFLLHTSKGVDSCVVVGWYLVGTASSSPVPILVFFVVLESLSIEMLPSRT
jgi:hypothetical protein